MSDASNRESSASSDEDAPRATVPSGFIRGRSGTHLYSLRALIEQIADAFSAEYRDSDALQQADTPAKRLALIVETANYIFAVESISIGADERASLIEGAYSELFSYGPLDPLLADPRVTTLLLKGSRETSVRFGHGDLDSAGQVFADETHLREIVNRLLEGADAPLFEDADIIEAGLTIGDRSARIMVVPPSLAFEMTADLRLHPAQMPMFEDLLESGFMGVEASNLLRTILRSRYGLAVVGDSESGKTVLLNAFAHELAHFTPPAQISVVQRAAEMRLPAGVSVRTTVWPREDRLGITFGEQITEALRDAPGILILDEVRADEPATIAPLLMGDAAPRQFWAVRGAPDAKRLQSALGMLARRAAAGQGESLVHALYERLPFVITLARIRGKLQIFSIAEWQSRVDTDYPDYVLLMRYEDGAARSTGARSSRWIDAMP